MLLRALFKRPAPAPTTPIGATFRLDRIDIDHVRRYQAAFGFQGDAIPLTFFYLLAQRAQLATMLACPIPFRIPGLIHVENRLALHGSIGLETPLALSTTLQLPPAAANGARHCVLATRAFDGERLVFACDSTYLIARGSRSGRAAPAPDTPSGAALGEWTVAPDAGRRYAALSGDWNPIHLWPWSARLMGMRAPIIHGAHTLAKACALLQATSGRDIDTLWCRFRQPVPLGAHVALLAGQDQGQFAVLCQGRIALEGASGARTCPPPAAAAHPAAA